VQIEDRTLGTLTVATELVIGNQGAPTSVQVDRPTQSTVTTARRQLMDALAVQASTGRVDLQLATMRDEQQMSARLGVKLTGSGWKANADVSVSGSLDVSKTVLKLTQEFYTITFLLLAVAPGRGHPGRGPDRVRVQPVPGPLHQRLHRGRGQGLTGSPARPTRVETKAATRHRQAAPTQAIVYWLVVSRMTPAPTETTAAPIWWAANTQPNTTEPA
jgi:hypothetical protein